MVSIEIDNIIINWNLSGFPSIGPRPVPENYGLSSQKEDCLNASKNDISFFKWGVIIYSLYVVGCLIYCIYYRDLTKWELIEIGKFFYFIFLPFLALLYLLVLVLALYPLLGILGIALFPIIELISWLKDKFYPPKTTNSLSKKDLYRKAVNEYDSKRKEIERIYNGIENDNYNFELFVKPRIEDFLKKIKLFIDYRNNQLRKEWWYSLDGYEFEIEVANWYIKQGYSATVTQKSGDGGIDIIVTDNKNMKTYIQCKHYTKNKVDAPTLQQLYGVSVADNAKCAIACLLGLTPQAQVFADKVGVEIITIKDLLGFEMLSGNQLSLFDKDGKPSNSLPQSLPNTVEIEDHDKIIIGDIKISTVISGTDFSFGNNIDLLNLEKKSIFFKNVYFSVSSSNQQYLALQQFLKTSW